MRFTRGPCDYLATLSETILLFLSRLCRLKRTFYMLLWLMPTIGFIFTSINVYLIFFFFFDNHSNELFRESFSSQQNSMTGGTKTIIPPDNKSFLNFFFLLQIFNHFNTICFAFFLLPSTHPRIIAKKFYFIILFIDSHNNISQHTRTHNWLRASKTVRFHYNTFWFIVLGIAKKKKHSIHFEEKKNVCVLG